MHATGGPDHPSSAPAVAPSTPRTSIPPGTDPGATLRDARRLAMLPDPASLRREDLAALAALTAAVLGAPRGLVSVVTEAEQQVIACSGGELPEAIPVAAGLCGSTIALGGPLLLGDLTHEDVPLLAAPVEPAPRAYAGTVLRIGGERVGTLCVTDSRARAWTLQDAERLEALGTMGSLLLERWSTTPGIVGHP